MTLHSPAPSLAFVTPSYPPDLERCALLVESLARFGPSYNHYIIVDRADREVFAPLAGPRTILIEAEAIIDARFIRIPWRGSSWYHWRTLPMRGWISQQVYKLAAIKAVPEDVLVMTDSDTTFVRPFATDDFMIDGKVGLLDVDHVAGKVPVWSAVAARMLGLSEVPSLRGHVGNLIAWHRDHITALHAHIEQATGLPWQIAVARQRTFSEYILYGIFVRQVLGYPASHHAPSTRALVKQPWDHDLTTNAGLKTYIETLEPDNIAVMIHSKDGLPASAARPHFEAAFARHD